MRPLGRITGLARPFAPYTGSKVENTKKKNEKWCERSLGQE